MSIVLSDDELIERLARDDACALAELYERHGRLAYGLALRVIGDPQLAEDAVQEAFVALRRTASSFDRKRGSARAWLVTLVHRRSVDIVRRQARRAPPSLDLAPTAVPSVEDQVMARLERERVRRALMELSPEHRQVVELAYYGALTQTEIAARLDLPLGTVKSRTFAALSRLRFLLASPDRDPVPS